MKDKFIRFFSSVAIRNILTFLVILLLVVTPLAYFYLADTRRNITDVLSANVAVAAQQGASLINAEEVALITNPNYLFTPEHDKLMGILKKIQSDFNVDNAVVYRRVESNKFVYVADGFNSFEIGSPVTIHNIFPATHAAALSTWDSGETGATRLFESGNSKFFQSNQPIKIGGRVVAVLMLNDDATAIADEITKRQQYIGTAAVVGIVFGIAAFWLVTFLTLRPLGRLRRAALRVSAGNLDFDIPPERGRNEIADLNQTFGVMVRDLRESREKIEEHNRTLEQRIAERTREIRGLLDNMDEGIFTISPAGEIMPGYSQATEEMLGEGGGSRNFYDSLILTPEERKTIEDTFALLVNPDLKVDWEDMVAFVPSEFESVSSQWLHARYRPTLNEEGERGEKIMVILKDITQERALKADIDKNQARQEMIVTILQNRENFESFYQDCLGMLEESGRILMEIQTNRRASVDSLFRTMHTIKGTAGLFGLAEVSKMAHGIEDTLRELRENRDQEISGEQRQAILQEIDSMRENLMQARATIIELIGGDDSDERSFTLTESKIGQIRQGVLENLSNGKREEISAILDRLMHVPVAKLSRKYKALISQLAQKLGKDTEFQLEDPDHVEMDPAFFGRLDASFIHIIRNAMDHAIETPEEREEKGKPPTARITLKSQYMDGGIAFSVSDDGRGINTEKVLQIGIDRGFVKPEASGDMSQEAIIDLLFVPGFSSAEEITDLSGRGVGLDVVKTDVKSLNGEMEIITQPGEGTSFQFRFPIPSETAESPHSKFLMDIKDEGEIESVVAWLVKNQAPVRLEIEQTSERFFSTFSAHPEGTEFTCSNKFREQIQKGTWIRARLPDLANRELRLQVISLREEANQTSGELIILANFGTSKVEDAKRISDRINTSHYKNIYYRVKSLDQSFRITDLSLTGLKLALTHDEEKELFPIGRKLPRGSIWVGERLLVNLHDTYARHASNHSIGLEFMVGSEGASLNNLKTFLNFLQAEEFKRA